MIGNFELKANLHTQQGHNTKKNIINEIRNKTFFIDVTSTHHTYCTRSHGGGGSSQQDGLASFPPSITAQ